MYISDMLTILVVIIIVIVKSSSKYNAQKWHTYCIGNNNNNVDKYVDIYITNAVKKSQF